MSTRRPTETQYRVLYGIRDHGDPYHGCQGRSQFGGRNKSLGSAQDRGWVTYDPDRDAFILTPTGRGLIDMSIDNPGETVAAINLTRQHLMRLVTVTDHAGEQVTGLLHRIELDADPRTRVQVRVATQEPTESGGNYWSTFSDYRFLNPDSLVRVQVGEPVPSWKPE